MRRRRRGTRGTTRAAFALAAGALATGLVGVVLAVGAGAGCGLDESGFSFTSGAGSPGGPGAGSDASGGGNDATSASGDGSSAFDGGPGDGDASGLDAPADAPPDGASSSLYACGDAGQMLSTCQTCPGAPINCDVSHRCVAFCRDDCSPTVPIACTTCGFGGSFTATCSKDNSPLPSCFDTCPCGSEADCPLPVDTCLDVGLTKICAACGEQGTADLTCKSGTGMRHCKTPGQTPTPPPADDYECK